MMSPLHDLSHPNQYLEDEAMNTMIRARIIGSGKERERLKEMALDDRLTVLNFFATSIIFFAGGFFLGLAYGGAI